MKSAALLLLACTACFEVQPLELPRSPGMHSALAIFARPGLPLLAIDLDANDPPQALLGDVDGLLILEYSRKLSIYQLSPGLVYSVDAGRPLPPSDAAWIAAPSGGLTAKSPDEAASELSAFRLPPLDPTACDRDSGCHRYERGAGICDIPCALDPVFAPDEPIPPEAVRFEKCPATWATVETSTLTGARYCLPPQRENCAAEERQAAEDATCVAIGAACPSGLWPENLPPLALHVLPGAPQGGDGTPARPFAAIAEALDNSMGGTTIALAKGTHDGDVAIEFPLTVIGACARDTLLTGSIQTRAPDVTLRNLSLEPNDPGADVFATTALNTRLEGVSIRGGERGVVVDGGQLFADDLAVRRATAGGIDVSGGSLVLTNAAVDDNDRGGVLVRRESIAQLENVAIRNTSAGAPELGHGMYLGGSRAAASRVSIEDSDGSGIFVDGSTLAFTSLAIRNSLGNTADGEDGRGIHVDRGVLEGEEVSTIGSRRDGIFAGNRSRANLVRVVSLEPDAQNGLHALDSLFTAAFVAVEGPNNYGIVCQNSVSLIEDFRVFDTGDGVGRSGDGVVVDGKIASLLRGTIERAHEYGFAALQSGSRSPLNVDIHDLAIRDTRRAGSENPVSIAFGVRPGATVTAQRISIDSSEGAGVLAALGDLTRPEPDSVSLSHLTARGTHGDGAIVLFGPRARFSVYRARLEPALGGGIVLRAGDVSLDHVLVRGANPAGLTLRTLMSAAEISVDLRNFELSDNRPTGINWLEGSLRLQKGLIEESDIGISTSAALFSPELIEQGVAFRSNGEDVLSP